MAEHGALLTFFFAPCAEPELLTRLRLLITSVFRLIGRGLPWSFRKRPQALQRTEPISSRRQSGVVEVVQFWQVGCVVSRSLAAMVAMIVVLGLRCYRGFVIVTIRKGEIFCGTALHWKWPSTPVAEVRSDT